MNDQTKATMTTTPSADHQRASDGPSTGAHLLALPELGRRTSEPCGHADAGAQGQASGALLNPLRLVKASLTVVVGTAEITIGELLGARRHQVLKLDRAVDAPVDILLEGHVVARGTLVAVDDHFGVRITELPTGLGAPLRPQDGSR